MRFIFSTGSLYNYSIERCFDFAAQAGFDGIELLMDGRWDTRQPSYLQKLSARHALPIIAIHSPFVPVSGWPNDAVARLLLARELAQQVGAEVLIHHLPRRGGHIVGHASGRRWLLPLPWWPVERDYARWLRTEYAAAQAASPVRLCIENMPAKRWLGRRVCAHHWNSVAEIVRFPHLTMDTTHLGTWGLEPVDVYRRWGRKVRHVHLSNFDGREHRRPEQGRLRLAALLAALAADGYDGAISLELHPDALDAGAADEHIIGLLRASLAHCRRWAAP